MESHSLFLPHRSSLQVILESALCIILNIVSLSGNTMVILAVYRNRRLRRTTNLYIIALAVSDLSCAAIEMPLTSATLITGSWIFGDATCQMEAFVDVFVTYVSPVTIGLTAFNRYVRIVKATRYNKIFSPRRSKLFLSLVWLLLFLYIVVAQSTGWQKFVFTPGYATCIIGHLSERRKLIHYAVLGLFCFIIPLAVSSYSYFKVFQKIHGHNLMITPHLQKSLSRAKITLNEIKMVKSLFFVLASIFLCWVPFWVILITERFSLAPIYRDIQMLAVLLLFLSSTINPFIYAFTNRAFRREFLKIVFTWKPVRRQTKQGTVQRVAVSTPWPPTCLVKQHSFPRVRNHSWSPNTNLI